MTYRAKIRDAWGRRGRYLAYEFECTCGAVGGRSTSLETVRHARKTHLRNAHGQ